MNAHGTKKSYINLVFYEEKKLCVMSVLFLFLSNSVFLYFDDTFYRQFPKEAKAAPHTDI
jgi:hypothetical protein